MYLSRILLDVRHPSVRQALRDCNDMHRNLMRAFDALQTQSQARCRGGVLYRLVETRHEVSLLLTSDLVPDRDALAGQGFFLAPDSPKDVSRLEQVFVRGLTLRFELLASPCKKVCSQQNNSRRYFLTTEDERTRWLIRKGQQNGFEVLESMEQGQVALDGSRQGMHIHHQGVRFGGVLRITDPQLFWKAYCGGIGPGKAYGLGMLTVSSL